MNEYQWNFEPIKHETFNFKPEAGFLVKVSVPVINLSELFGLESVDSSMAGEAKPKFGGREITITVMKDGFDLFLNYLSGSELLDEVDFIIGTNLNSCDKLSDLRMVKIYKHNGSILVNKYLIDVKPIIDMSKPVEGFKFNYIKE
jgi:hypothetical protein